VLTLGLLWPKAPVAAPAPVVVSILMPAVEVVEWQPIVTAFNREHRDIQLAMLEGPTNTDQLESLYTTSFLLGDSPYDLVDLDISWLPKFAAAGWLLDISERLSPTEQAAFLSPDLEGGRFQNKLYRLPTYTGAGLLYYRQDLLTQAGLNPPQTFADLIAAAKILQNQGQVAWGYLWQGKQYEGLSAMFVEVLAGFGGYWVNPDTLSVGLDEPETLQAVEFLRQTITSGISPPGVTTYAEEDTRRLFQAGKALFLRNWPYVYPLANTADSPIQGKFAIQPMVHQPGRAPGACQGGWGLGIARGTRHPEAAWEVLRYLTSEAVQKQFSLATGKMPTRQALYQDSEILAKFPYFAALYPVLETAVLRPPITQYAQASDILQRYLSAALTGRLTPNQALHQASQETRRLLGQAPEEK
jgi:multiple sugar transport system substrate-binding protein